MTEGRKLTDKQLRYLEEAIEEEYLKAQKRMEKELAKRTEDFDTEDSKKLKMFLAGTLTATAYSKWRREQLTSSAWIKNTATALASEQTKVNQRVASLIGNILPTAFAESYNFGTYQIEKAAKVNTFFNLWNVDAVKRLIFKRPQLLPKPTVDIPLDRRWNERQIRAAFLRSFIKGEGTRKTAERLLKAGMKTFTVSDIKNRDKMTAKQIAKEVTRKNRNAAIRNARTMMTSAENAGKLESYRRAERLGIKLKKMWSATMDDRTRDSHAFLDGVTVGLEEEFPNGLMYPGDLSGSPEEVWNCRCELSMQLDGFSKDPSDLTYRNTDHFAYRSYDEWKRAHRE